MAALLPVVAEGADIGVEVFRGGEDSLADCVAVVDGEEDLDRVGPRNASEVGEVMDAGVYSQVRTLGISWMA